MSSDKEIREIYSYSIKSEDDTNFDELEELVEVYTINQDINEYYNDVIIIGDKLI